MALSDIVKSLEQQGMAPSAIAQVVTAIAADVLRVVQAQAPKAQAVAPMAPAMAYNPAIRSAAGSILESKEDPTQLWHISYQCLGGAISKDTTRVVVIQRVQLNRGPGLQVWLHDEHGVPLGRKVNGVKVAPFDKAGDGTRKIYTAGVRTICLAQTS